ncbi:MAG: DsbA family protein [Gammaproteobacteria bacterium]|nr:DsbA family protein [Gammaproteobacteria bacterium]
MTEIIKVYFDVKSPYSYLAVEPLLSLENDYDVLLRWIPFSIPVPDMSERDKYGVRRVRYLYKDARRWANRRGGMTIKGPRKIYDSTPALMGALFADREGYLVEYLRAAFAGFFNRALEIDQPEAVAEVIASVGGDSTAYHAFVSRDGAAAMEAGMSEADEDEVFGVPAFVLRGELFWGQDRIPMLAWRLEEYGAMR